MPTTATRGSKRGRAEAFPEKDENPDRIAHKMHHMAKEAKRSAKKAKTFETQKLVKKLKALKKDGTTSGDDQLAQLERQLEALKNMDHELIGLWALRSKLKKDKVLSQDPAVTQAIASELEVAPMSDEDEVITLVRNRFLSSKTLASDVSAAATALRAMLHPQDDAAAEAETSTRTTTHEEAPIRKKTKIVKEARPLGDGDEDDVQHPEEGQTMEVAAEQEDEDDGWESGSVADSDGESDSSTTGRKGKVTATSKSATSSTFLPSLSVGFIRGESDSDYSDEEKEDVAEPKKNRRGQRARRAIWEKKFGKNANHVVKGLPTVSPPGKNASGGRHAPGGSNPRFNGGAGGRPRPAPPAFGSGAGRPAFRQPPAAAVPEVLHPSWEAKRKLKEKQSTAIVPAQGKKITFT
ncbi:BUD22-domain-containing protein [Pterulicium gracile]|uniref:BUD22-domain-containing protein n=1 Tax=Pterulicium gracile TaxID=1884261 RepID=A0A5C3QU38_9AGAR|nr:BUD22-domain-containing protein [Pterula gracilis]